MNRHLASLIAAAVLALFAWPATSPAQAPGLGAEGFVGHMTPASVARGRTTRVALHGDKLGRALNLWTSLPPGKTQTKVIESASSRATFDVTVAADCPLGLHGLRLASDDGLTNPIIFLVDDLSPQSVEAAKTGDAVASIKLPAALAGTLRPAQIDRFAIDVAAGEAISFECVSSRLGKDSDPLLRIRDANGRVVIERDNDPGLFFDFRGEHVFSAAGRYVVELCDARFHGDPEWSYILRLGRFPAARVAVPSSVRVGQSVTLAFPELPGLTSALSVAADAPLGRFYHELRRPGDAAASWIAVGASDLPTVVEVEPNNAAEQGTTFTLPAVLCGVLTTPNDIDLFAVELKKGDRVELRAEAALFDSAADIELAVIGPDGKEMQRVDDVLLDEASLTLAANRDGVYQVLVHDVTRGGGPAFAYRVAARRAGPSIALLADFADLTIPQDEYQALPLILTRDACPGPVQLSLVGVPPGVSISPEVIPEGQNSLVAQIRADSSAPLGVHTLQVRATAEVNGEKLSTMVRAQPLIDRQRFNVDLIKYALRDNQRRLPPSLADRIALQITPPAPFSVEQPEPVVTLVRFLSVEFPIHTTRQPGFAAPINFKARGGQIGEEREIRRQIYTRFAPATPQQLTPRGAFFSRNLPNEAKDRVDLSATAQHDGRQITLVRCFDLDLKAGFDVRFEPPTVTMFPGETARFQLQVVRVPPFAGAVTVEQSDQPGQAPPPGITLPETIVIPADKTSVEVELKVAADFMPRKFRVRLPSKATVGQFLEEPRPKDLEIDVKKPEPKLPEKKA